MKKYVTVLLSIIIALGLSAQDNPVKWDFEATKVNATEYEVNATAIVEEGWHIYSQYTQKGGPVATSFRFAKNPLISLKDDIKEVGKMEKRFEPLFNVEVMQYSGKVIFVQKLLIKGKAKTSVNGSVEYMTCNERECMPPTTKRFSVILP